MTNTETLMQTRRRMIRAGDDPALSRQVGVEHEDAAAYHEAGHAAAAAILEVPFQYVTLRPEDGGRPRIHYGYTVLDVIEPFPLLSGSNRVPGGLPMALNAAIVIMSGVAAELRQCGADSDLASAGASDRQRLALLSGFIRIRFGLHEDPMYVIEHWAWREACRMVANLRAWRAVCSLAGHLEMHEAVGEATVLEIVHEAQVRWRPGPWSGGFDPLGSTGLAPGG